MNIDHIETEYKEVYAEMKGISPKMDAYKRLEIRLAELKEKMGGKGVGNMTKFLSRKDNRFVKIKKNKSTQPFSGRITEEKQTICNKPGCTRQRKHCGRTSTGLIKYRTRCAIHMKEDKKNHTNIHKDIL